MIIVQAALMSALNGVNPGSESGCKAVAWTLLVVTLGVACVFGFLFPLRSRMLSIAHAVTLLCLGCIIGKAIANPSTSPVFVLLYLYASQVEMVLTCGVAFWEMRLIPPLEMLRVCGARSGLSK